MIETSQGERTGEEEEEEREGDRAGDPGGETREEAWKTGNLMHPETQTTRHKHDTGTHQRRARVRRPLVGAGEEEVVAVRRREVRRGAVCEATGGKWRGGA